MSSYPWSSVGVPGLAAHVGGWVCGGLHGVFVCMLFCGGSLGVSWRVGMVGGHSYTRAYDTI
jgi:hypothetical protein